MCPEHRFGPGSDKNPFWDTPSKKSKVCPNSAGPKPIFGDSLASPLGKIHVRKTHPQNNSVNNIRCSLILLLWKLLEIKAFASEVPTQIRNPKGLATMIRFYY